MYGMWLLLMFFLALPDNARAVVGIPWDPSTRRMDAFTGFVHSLRIAEEDYPQWQTPDNRILLFPENITDVGRLCRDDRPGVVYVRRTAIYWVTLRYKPVLSDKKDGELKLMVNDNNIIASLRGGHFPTSFSIALRLTYGDIVRILVSGQTRAGDFTMFSIVETRAESAYTAFYNAFDPPRFPDRLSFGERVTDVGVTMNLFTAVITVSNSGVYLFSISVDNSVNNPENMTDILVYLSRRQILIGRAFNHSHYCNTVAVYMDEEDEIFIYKDKVWGLVSRDTFISFAQIQQDPTYAINVNGQWRSRAILAQTKMSFIEMFNPDAPNPVASIHSSGTYIACISTHDVENSRLHYGLIVNGRWNGVETELVDEGDPPNAVCAGLLLFRGDNVTVEATLIWPGPIGTNDSLRVQFAEFSLVRVQNSP